MLAAMLCNWCQHEVDLYSLLITTSELLYDCAGGMAMGPGPAKRYKGRTTPYVIMTCIVAASGGALFGYDNGDSPAKISRAHRLLSMLANLLQAWVGLCAVTNIHGAAQHTSMCTVKL